MNKIADENYLDLIIDSNIARDYGPSENITKLTNRLSLLQVDASGLDECALGRYPYHFFPAIATLNAQLNYDSSIDRVQENPNLALFGRGVLVGVIDTGIDYRHAAFRNNDGTSRIYSLWDQTINEENVPPEGFFYGMEFDRGMLNAALASPDPLAVVPSRDEIGHGTILAGMIAGNDEKAGYRGVVPEAELVVVKMKQAKRIMRKILFVPEQAIAYQVSDIISGVNYVASIAKKLDRPYALCISQGSNQSHDGAGAFSSFLATLCETSRLGIAVSAGNEAGKRRHYLGKVEMGRMTEFELRVGNADRIFSMRIYQKSPQRLVLEITSPSGQTFRNLYPQLNECRRLNFVLEQSVVWVNNISVESQTGDQLILVRFQNPAGGLWKFRVNTVEWEGSTFHAWLPSGDIISEETYFVDPNPETTITDPGNVLQPLTVANYDVKTNSIVQSSGRGPTRDGRMKPDLAAPGYELSGPVPDDDYATATGTGVSAAIATGIIAMVLEWAVLRGNDTSIIGSEVSRLLVHGARQTQSIAYPNTEWGYGAIDAYGFFEKLT